jgi:23S rRNA (cytosine1962-C5)-methyltransferase
MGFKHTGLFPEQAVNWDIMTKLIKNAGRPVSVLNLFAYTGGATVACLAADASVCHVDSAKNMVERAKENIRLSGLSADNARFIVDDCKKFVTREIRRGKKYDAIIMDPPSFGRGSNGEVWKLENDLADFFNLCSKVLTDNPLFVLINSYTTGLQPTVLENMLKISLKDFEGETESYEVGLPTSEGIVLPCGASGLFRGVKK